MFNIFLKVSEWSCSTSKRHLTPSRDLTYLTHAIIWIRPRGDPQPPGISIPGGLARNPPLSDGCHVCRYPCLLLGIIIITHILTFIGDCLFCVLTREAITQPRFTSCKKGFESMKILTLFALDRVSPYIKIVFCLHYIEYRMNAYVILMIRYVAVERRMCPQCVGMQSIVERQCYESI